MRVMRRLVWLWAVGGGVGHAHSAQETPGDLPLGGNLLGQWRRCVNGIHDGFGGARSLENIWFITPITWEEVTRYHIGAGCEGEPHHTVRSVRPYRIVPRGLEILDAEAGRRVPAMLIRLEVPWELEILLPPVGLSPQQRRPIEDPSLAQRDIKVVQWNVSARGAVLREGDLMESFSLQMTTHQKSVEGMNPTFVKAYLEAQIDPNTWFYEVVKAPMESWLGRSMGVEVPGQFTHIVRKLPLFLQPSVHGYLKVSQNLLPASLTRASSGEGPCEP